MNEVENEFADIISRLEAPKKGKIFKCRLCKYGDSPCDWCINDPDGVGNFEPKENENERN